MRWSDLALRHEVHETRHGIRYTINEVARWTTVDRQLTLNHECYAEEVRAGLHDVGKPKARAAKVAAPKVIAGEDGPGAARAV